MTTYKNLEKRKEYLKLWRVKNRNKVYKYHKRWRNKINNKNDIKDGTSGLGRKYEEMALRLLKGSKDSKNFGERWDIEWNGIKIDVKMRNIHKGRNQWVFENNKSRKCDYLLLFCVENKIVKSVYFIPLSETPLLSITISKNSKRYKKYLLK